MNRFQILFAEGKNKAFIPFFTIGDPGFEQSLMLVQNAVDAGCDALELGFPFSDPIADGPTNQRSMARALRGGMNFARGLEFLSRIRKRYPELPIGLLLYYNLLFKQGEQAYQSLAEIGVDAIVIADLPLEEAGAHFKLLHKYEIGAVPMIAPNADDARVKALSRYTGAFNYVLSAFGTTGTKSEVAEETLLRIQKLRSLVNTPLVVGFGLSSVKHVLEVWQAGADGAIVGSLFTAMIEKNLNKLHDASHEITSFIRQVKAQHALFRAS